MIEMNLSLSDIKWCKDLATKVLVNMVTTFNTPTFHLGNVVQS